MILVYHRKTGTYFDLDDDVVLIDLEDLNASELKALEDGDDSALEDVAYTSLATPFWEAFDPFKEHPNNPNKEEDL